KEFTNEIEIEIAGSEIPTIGTTRGRCNQGPNCGDCKTESGCKFFHADPAQLCLQRIRRGDGSVKTCGFSPKTHLLIEQLPDYDGYLHAREEDIRDVLFIPNKHFSNKSLIFQTQFWDILPAVAKLINSRIGDANLFAVYRIALNFGKWETAVSLNDLNLSCHGHGHFLLSPLAIKNCEKFLEDNPGRIEDDKTFKPSWSNLIGKTGTSTNY